MANTELFDHPTFQSADGRVLFRWTDEYVTPSGSLVGPAWLRFGPGAAKGWNSNLAWYREMYGPLTEVLPAAEAAKPAGVTVETFAHPELVTHTYPRGVNWSTDDDHELDVEDAEGNIIATYQPGRWCAVYETGARAA